MRLVPSFLSSYYLFINQTNSFYLSNLVQLRIALISLMRPVEPNSKYGQGLLTRQNTKNFEEPFEENELISLSNNLVSKGTNVDFSPPPALIGVKIFKV